MKGAGQTCVGGKWKMGACVHAYVCVCVSGQSTQQRRMCVCRGVEEKIAVHVCLYNFEYKCVVGDIKMGCGLCVNIPRRLPVFT